MSDPGDITRLLQLADQGDVHAADELFRLVQRELEAIAGKRKWRVSGGKDISTIGLVDEAFCKLVGQNVTLWRPGDRSKFFVYAATKIHDLLIQTGRNQAARKRGGDRKRVELESGDLSDGDQLQDTTLLLDLHTALAKLDDFAADESSVFRIRYFLGCTFQEIAELLNISETESRRRFKRAQLLLQKELKAYHHDS